MGTKKSYIEVFLMGEPILESSDLQSIVEEAQRKGFKLSELRVDPVVYRNETWLSHAESTEDLPILYLEKEGRPTALILQTPEDSTYRMYKYRWMG